MKKNDFINVSDLKSGFATEGSLQKNQPVEECLNLSSKTSSQMFHKWLTSEEVCHLLGISKRTLQSYRDRRILPFAQTGRKIYYKSSDIDDYLDAHYIKANYQRGGEYGEK